MIFNIVTDFDIKKQEDIEMKIDIPESKVREIVDRFFYTKEFVDRRKWLSENITKVDSNTV